MRQLFSTKVALIVLTVLAWSVVLLLSTREAQSLAKDGIIDPRVRGAVIVYWALACVTIVLVGAARKHKKEATLLFASLVAALGLAEVVLRTFQLFPELTMLQPQGLRSSRYHHILSPKKLMSSWPIDGRYFAVSTNEDGFRTEHSLEDFNECDVRIAVLGDSFTYGLCDANDTFPTVLEQLLQKGCSQQKVGVLNTGLPSYSPIIEKSVYLGKVRKYRPQIVILMLDASDIGDDIVYRRELHRFGDSLFFAVDDPDTVTYSGAIAQLLKRNLTYPLAFLPKEKDALARTLSTRRDYRCDVFDLEIGGDPCIRWMNLINSNTSNSLIA